MRRNTLFMTVAGAACGCLMCISVPVGAFARIIPASKCVLDSSNPQGTPVSSAYYGSTFNTSSSNSIDLLCPVPYDSFMPLNIFGSAHINGYNNGGYDLGAYACRTYNGGGGGQCSSVVHSAYPTPGPFQIALTGTAMSPWTSGAYNDSYYVRIYLGPQWQGLYNILFDYERLDSQHF
jgi:hypothetical protein